VLIITCRLHFPFTSDRTDRTAARYRSHESQGSHGNLESGTQSRDCLLTSCFATARESRSESRHSCKTYQTIRIGRLTSNERALAADILQTRPCRYDLYRAQNLGSLIQGSSLKYSTLLPRAMEIRRSPRKSPSVGMRLGVTAVHVAFILP